MTVLLELYLLWSSLVMDLYSPGLVSSLLALVLRRVMLRWVGSFPVDLDPSLVETLSCRSVMTPISEPPCLLITEVSSTLPPVDGRAWAEVLNVGSLSWRKMSLLELMSDLDPPTLTIVTLSRF